MFRVVVFVLLRLCIALFSPAYIHPDEHFQNPQVSANLNFSVHDAIPLTWEWQLPNPVRSIVPVYLSTGWVFGVVGRISQYLSGQGPSSRTLFLAERFTFFLLSWFNDLAVYCLVQRPRTAWAALSLSGVTLTFILRPFSNSIESSLVSICLTLLTLATQRLKAKKATLALIALGIPLALGVWSRITFVPFVAVAYASLINNSFKSLNFQKYSLYEVVLIVILQLLPVSLSFLITACLCIYIDSLYFGKFVVTPLNLLLYNTDSISLAQHGLHPRWLHCVVNMPMLYAPFLFALVLKSPDERRKLFSNSTSQVCAAYTILTLVLLSLTPHQEPRFLISLHVPICLLAFGTTRPLRPFKKHLIAFFTLHTLAMVIVYGFIHQGGVIPTLLNINNQLRTPNSEISQKCRDGLEFIFWKTYLPPNYLLSSTQRIVPECAKIQLRDLAGAPVDKVVEYLQDSTKNTGNRILVAPVYHIADSLLSDRLDLHAVKESGAAALHVDFDDLAEIVQSSIDRARIGVWIVVSR